MKTIKSGLIAAAFALGVFACEKNDKIYLESLDIVGCPSATAYFNDTGYSIVCDKDHYFTHVADLDDSDDLVWGNEDYHDVNKDGLVDVYFNRGSFELNRSSVVDSRYENLLSKLKKPFVQGLWQKNWRQ